MKINSYEVDGAVYRFSETDIRDVIDELEYRQSNGLIDASQQIYNTIMPTSGGKTIAINHAGRKMSKNFRFIDFKNPENNAFHVSLEFSASGKQNIRPDIVCFVNGIPFVVIENKKSSVSVEEAINQMNRNQSPEYCPKLYTYAQLLIATNGKELRYGTTGTPKNFYASWKEKGTSLEETDKQVKALIEKKIDAEVYQQVLSDLNTNLEEHTQALDRLPTEQDRSVFNLLQKDRLLDLTKNYILFDGGIKKISRYQQYFAIHKMLKRTEEIETISSGVTRRKGGLVWHTQGSGKSLTMVMFVKALIEDPNILNPRVIIVTDRRDLDRQIRDTFKDCNLKKEVIQAKSGSHLLKMIQEKDLSVITTLIQKFESVGKKNVDFIDEDQNIFVLIDEAHRSQSGAANFEMKKVIPNACYIGFTGTPLMKNEKESWRKFGGYIDKYTIDDALEDKIILPLIYEGRYVDLVQNTEQIDRYINRITEGLTSKQKIELQKHISTKIIKNNPQRIVEIGFDIEKHFIENFQNTGLKAQIVAPSKFSAILLQKFFEERGKVETAVVISDEQEDGEEADTHKREVVKYLDKIRENHSSVSRYEKSVIESFKKQDDGIEIIIVVDKLLTGFDAPRNTVLYLAKDLRDHNLLQAIARVNRLYENKKEKPKTAGYIVDYSENAKNINFAMKLFGYYEEDDVKGALTDTTEKIQELEQSYALLFDLFKSLKGRYDDEEYLQFLSDKSKRVIFYKSLNLFIKNLSECFILQDFSQEFKHLDLYKKELKKFIELRKSANLRYADKENLSEYKLSLVSILDKYVDARGVELLTRQIDITDRKLFEEEIANLGSDKSKAEAIAAQTKKTITERVKTDPEFYEKFSRKITDILEKMRQQKIEDLEALKQLKLIRDDVLNKKDEELPERISSKTGAGIFYRNLKNIFEEYSLDDETYISIVLDIFQIIQIESIVDWYKNIVVKKRIQNSIDDYLYDVVKKEQGINLSTESMNSIIDKAIKLAENNTDLFK